MSRTIYVNGRYQPYSQAGVHVEDRGFQFADGVYEVCEVRDGCLVDETRHMKRLMRSMNELQFSVPMSLKALGLIMRETVRRNRIDDGIVYVQITRGVAKRDFIFPPDDVEPSIVCIARSIPRSLGDQKAKEGIAVKTMPDIRWKRPDIKTVSLLPNALARQAAKEAGASEAWLVDSDGFVTEGAASNAWIVDEKGQLITRSADFGILRGITRSVVIDLADRESLTVVERSFTVEEAQKSREAFITSATSVVTPVVRINDKYVGNGKPGAFACKLRSLFHTQSEIAIKGFNILI